MSPELFFIYILHIAGLQLNLHTVYFVGSRLNTVTKNKHKVKCKKCYCGYTRPTREPDLIFITCILLIIGKIENNSHEIDALLAV